jgi:antitoxin component of RelBE/YafQ-DinJ toxin-antitoxin module
MNTVTLQVPMDKKIRDAAAAVAGEYGFSSLQEVIRVLAAKLAKRELNVSVEQFPVVKLSKKNEKRYTQMESDFRANRNVYHANDLRDFLHQLNA